MQLYLRERGGRAQVGPPRVRPAGGRWHALLRRRRRAPLDLAADADAALPANGAPLDLAASGGLPGLRGRRRGGRVAPAAGPLVVPPLQQHVADAGRGRGGGVGRVRSVVMRVVARRAPTGRRRGRRLRRAGAQRRLGVERGRGEVGGEAGAVGGHGRRVVVLVRRPGRQLSRHGSPTAAVTRREAVRAEPLVPAAKRRSRISNLIGQGNPLQNACNKSLAIWSGR
jgi:hypothetical protein